MKRIVRIKIFVFLLFVICAANAFGQQQRFVANLSGAQEAPTSGSTGKGVCSVLLNGSETQIMVSCTYSNLSGAVAGAHIHGNAAPRANAPVLFNFNFTGAQSGNFGGTFGVSLAQVAALRSNLFYVNVHTANFPNGEIRGQLKISNGSYNDYDGDGQTDVSVYRTSNNTFYTLSSVNNVILARQIGQPGDSVSLNADFDGDGLADYAAVRLSQTDGQITWRIFESASATLRAFIWGNPTLGDILSASDFDGDGRIDPAVFRAGVWYIIESSTGNFRYEYWGQSGDVPTASDFDKDGKSDLAVARNENGVRVWYIRRSSDMIMRRVEWGLNSDAFFAGRIDFDGDGASDILVIRNQSGQRVWYVLRSSDNQFQVFQWGLSSDLVRIGDYDGDGRTDFVVSRNVGSEKIWFINQSSNGQTRVVVWGLPGDF
jgi:hypothetical protein